jgi:hypothetical protein
MTDYEGIFMKAAEQAREGLGKVELLIPFLAMSMLQAVAHFQKTGDPVGEQLLGGLYHILQKEVIQPGSLCLECTTRRMKGRQSAAFEITVTAIAIAIGNYFGHSGDCQKAFRQMQDRMDREAVDPAKTRDAAQRFGQQLCALMSSKFGMQQG